MDRLCLLPNGLWTLILLEKPSASLSQCDIFNSSPQKQDSLKISSWNSLSGPLLWEAGSNQLIISWIGFNLSSLARVQTHLILNHFNSSHPEIWQHYILPPCWICLYILFKKKSQNKTKPSRQNIENEYSVAPCLWGNIWIRVEGSKGTGQSRLGFPSLFLNVWLCELNERGWRAHTG